MVPVLAGRVGVGRAALTFNLAWLHDSRGHCCRTFKGAKANYTDWSSVLLCFCVRARLLTTVPCVCGS